MPFWLTLPTKGVEEAGGCFWMENLTSRCRGLRNHLVETLHHHGERFPEYEAWQAAEKVEKEKHWKRIKELEGDPTAMLCMSRRG